MAMAEESFPTGESEPQEEVRLDATDLLLEYVRAQFEAAYQKERIEDLTQGTALDNGSFYQPHVIPGAEEHPLTRNSKRIVMQKPFSTMVLSTKKEFVELYAIMLRDEDGHEDGEPGGFIADQYIVRRYSNGRFSPHELITDEGVFRADVSEFDPVAGFGVSDLQDDTSLISQLEDVFAPVERAHNLYQLLSGYNIVATDD